MLTIIAAVAENGVIGKNGKIPWRIPEDLNRFKKLTMGHCVIMGRKTFESLPKPLPGRTNIILTRNKNYVAKNAIVVHSVFEALEMAIDDPMPFVIGGSEIYEQFLDKCHRIEWTQVTGVFEGDAFFPDFDASKFKQIGIPEKFTTHRYITYERNE